MLSPPLVQSRRAGPQHHPIFRLLSGLAPYARCLRLVWRLTSQIQQAFPRCCSVSVRLKRVIVVKTFDVNLHHVPHRPIQKSQLRYRSPGLAEVAVCHPRPHQRPWPLHREGSTTVSARRTDDTWSSHLFHGYIFQVTC